MEATYQFLFYYLWLLGLPIKRFTFMTLSFCMYTRLQQKHLNSIVCVCYRNFTQGIQSTIKTWGKILIS